MKLILPSSQAGSHKVVGGQVGGSVVVVVVVVVDVVVLVVVVVVVVVVVDVVVVVVAQGLLTGSRHSQVYPVRSPLLTQR